MADLDSLLDNLLAEKKIHQGGGGGAPVAAKPVPLPSGDGLDGLDELDAVLNALSTAPPSSPPSARPDTIAMELDALGGSRSTGDPRKRQGNARFSSRPPTAAMARGPTEVQLDDLLSGFDVAPPSRPPARPPVAHDDDNQLSDLLSSLEASFTPPVERKPADGRKSSEAKKPAAEESNKAPTEAKKKSTGSSRPPAPPGEDSLRDLLAAVDSTGNEGKTDTSPMARVKRELQLARQTVAHKQQAHDELACSLWSRETGSVDAVVWASLVEETIREAQKLTRSGASGGAPIVPLEYHASIREQAKAWCGRAKEYLATLQILCDRVHTGKFDKEVEGIFMRQAEEQRQGCTYTYSKLLRAMYLYDETVKFETGLATMAASNAVSNAALPMATSVWEESANVEVDSGMQQAKDNMLFMMRDFFDTSPFTAQKSAKDYAVSAVEIFKELVQYVNSVDAEAFQFSRFQTLAVKELKSLVPIVRIVTDDVRAQGQLSAFAAVAQVRQKCQFFVNKSVAYLEVVQKLKAGETLQSLQETLRERKVELSAAMKDLLMILKQLLA